MASATMTLTVDTKWGLAGIRLARWLIPVIGPLRAARLGAWAANHLFRYRIDGGRWRPLTPNVSVTAFGELQESPGTGEPMEGIEVKEGETGTLTVDDPALPKAPDIEENDE